MSVVSISVPLWLYEGTCEMAGILQKASTSVSKRSLLNKYEEISALNVKSDKGVKVSDTRRNERDVQIKINRVEYFPHNDTIITTYKCLHEGASSQNAKEEILHRKICTFQDAHVSIVQAAIYYC